VNYSRPGCLSAQLYEWECTHVLGRTDQDVAFWLEVARNTPGPCLELACGTGRVSLRLAAAGVDVVGLDLDPSMVTFAASQQARSRQGLQPCRARFLAGDMRRFSLHERFGAALIPYNSLQLLTDLNDQRDCLALAAAHLAEGGVVGLEVTDFQQGATRTAVDDEVLHRGWLGEDRVTVIGSLTHDLDTRVSRYRRRFVASAWTVEDEAAIRSMSQAEVGDLLTVTGLAPLQWWTSGPVMRVVATPSAALSSSRCRDEHRERR
jgi:SAM-dependent methyltransferase